MSDQQAQAQDVALDAKHSEAGGRRSHFALEAALRHKVTPSLQQGEVVTWVGMPGWAWFNRVLSIFICVLFISPFWIGLVQIFRILLDPSIDAHRPNGALEFLGLSLLFLLFSWTLISMHIALIARIIRSMSTIQVVTNQRILTLVTSSPAVEVEILLPDRIGSVLLTRMGFGRYLLVAEVKPKDGDSKDVQSLTWFGFDDLAGAKAAIENLKADLSTPA